MMLIEWWPSAYTSEKSFAFRPGAAALYETNRLVSDTDGDGIVDGADDLDCGAQSERQRALGEPLQPVPPEPVSDPWHHLTSTRATHEPGRVRRQGGAGLAPAVVARDEPSAVPSGAGPHGPAPNSLGGANSRRRRPTGRMDPDARSAALDDLAAALRERLIAEAGGAEGDLHGRIRALVDREAALLDAASRDELVARVAERSFGLGPLEPLLRDPTVDEVMVNGAGAVWVERAGRLEATEVAFGSDDEVRHAIERILAPLGRRVDEAEPLCDARLLDGSRVNVVIPPLALDGPVLTIRRFRHRGYSDEDLVALGTWTPPLRTFLARAVRARLNVLVTGGTGSGKTTTLNALSSFVPEGERIVTIEDTAELRLRQPHVVRLEARPPSVEGRGEVTIRRLVRNALRMRPDRIVVGEVRGPEALDMLAAMSTGHDGSLCTVHAGSPEEALRRLETLALMAGLGLPHAAIREQVSDAIDLIVHQSRLADGSRRVVTVAEVVRVAAGPATREVYGWRGNRPVWRAPLGEDLAQRLGEAA
jgi:pilus assembly protein CpaF